MNRPAARGRGVRRAGRVPLASSAFRLRVMILLVAILFSVVGARAVQIQVISAKAMAAEATKGMTVVRTMPAERGTITGRDGQVMAFTESTVDVVADPSMISTNGKEPEAMKDADHAKGERAPAEMASIIARHLEVPAEEVEARLRRADTRYQLLAKQVQSVDWVDLIAELNLGGYVGIFRESNPRRVYPMGTVASNIVGYMSEGEGIGGLEYSRQADLAGTPGKESYETSPNGRIPLGNQVLEPAVDGSDVQLTIDPDLQWMVEQRLASRVDEVGGNWGVALVMDVETGELLTMANYPSFDSNDFGGAETADLGNRAVTAAYEPGSVQKVLTVASLLDAGVTTPDTTYSIGPTVKVGDHEVSDAFGQDDIDFTTRGILVRSSNVGAITAARDLAPDRLRQYMVDFGLGEKTALGLPGEAGGSVPAVGMPSYQADSMAFGYGLSVTSVQMAAAVAAVANGGVYTEPSLVRATEGSDGSPGAAPATRRVISEEAARQTVEMMNQRTIYSTKQIGVPGYNTGAKTGSARLASASGYSGQVASIIGVGPVEDPQVLVYVLVARPDTAGAGLSMAGPVYKDIMSLALPRYGVSPTSEIVDTQLPLVKE